MIKKIINILSEKEKNDLGKLGFLTIINSFIESLSISLIFPILNFIFNKHKINDEIIFSNYLIKIIDKFQNNILYPLFILFFIFFFKSCYQLFFNWFQIKTIADIEINIAERTYSSFLKQDYQNAIKKNSSIIIEILSREIKNFVSCLLQFTNLMLEVVLILILVIIMFFYFGTIFLKILMFIIFLISTVYLFVGRRFKIWGQLRHEFYTNALKNMMQGINSFKEVKLYKKEKYFNDEYIKNLKKGLNFLKKISFFSSMPKIIYELLFVLIISFLFFFYNKNSYNFNSSIPVFVFTGAAILRILPGLNRITLAISQINSYSISVNKIYEILSDHSKKKEKLNDLNIYEVKKNKILVEKIVIKNLSFKYENQTEYVLNNINLDIQKGEMIGIKGQTGSGKTTLINLVCGLNNIQKGEILINDKNLVDIKDAWQNCIGYVPQKVYLTDDTIENNIIFGSGFNNSLDTLNKVLEITQCKNFVNQLPNRINSRVGENGVFLSGGQIQRLGVARALFINPAFLILDEATNALDLDTENKLLNKLNRIVLEKDLIILIISHKDSTLNFCKKIYELKNGKLNLI